MGLLSWMKTFSGPEDDEMTLTGEKREGYVSKELFYNILDLESAIVLFFTESSGWIGANKVFFEIFAFENINEFRATHESIRELFVEEAEEIFTEYDKSWLDYLRIHKTSGYGVRIKDRKEEERSFVAKSRQIKQGGKELYVLELEDKTELENARQEAQDVERLKRKFLANIGHEFRTPMNGILGFVELLENSEPTEKQREYLDMIHASGQSLMSNIESLLDLAQMESGRLKVSNAEFNPISELEELARIYAITARDKGISLYFFIDPKLPAFLEGDLRKIKQILTNLVSNAVKFTKSGGRINIDVKLVKRSGTKQCSVGFSVRDTGKGIPQKQLAIITQPFVAGEHADERLGVGLSLSHGMVQLLGGKLHIQSEEGRGSSFSFVLDFAASQEQALNVVDGKSVKVALLNEKRIDDANFLTLYLRSFGINVIKVHMIDENIFTDVDLLYLVGTQEESAWTTKLATYTKKCPVAFLLNPGEKLALRLNDIVDHVLMRPLLPTQLYDHLTQVHRLPSKKPVEEQQPEVDVRPKRPIRALVAEDNLINQRLIKILLHEYKIEVRTAINGDEAVKACAAEDFDIVFMDIDMPVKDGILATKEIKGKRHHHPMPIVALTALAMDGDREHLLEEGLDDYLSKPLTREKLEHILRKHIKLSK